MDHAETTARAFWAELWHGAKYWLVDNIDGQPPPARLSVSAYCASCPRCFQEKEHLEGKLWICDGCGLTVEGLYRRIDVPLPRGNKIPAEALKKIGLVIGNLAALHPLALRQEHTTIDLARWFEFIDKRQTWGDMEAGAH